jgi:hypothetical protein
MSASLVDKPTPAERLHEGIARVRALREDLKRGPGAAQDRLLVRAWQADRLARTYPDLLASPRFGRAAAFFLSDLYGPKDFSERDEAVARIVPTLAALLPAAAIETIALAIELDGLSESLDQRLAQALRSGQPAANALEITEQAYAEAYRRGAKADRERQIELVGRIGAGLDRVSRKPLIAGALRLMAGPAHAAGLGALHEFLASGFEAFRHMRGADEFLATIAARETRINDRLFAGVPRPFDIER